MGTKNGGMGTWTDSGNSWVLPTRKPIPKRGGGQAFRSEAYAAGRRVKGRPSNKLLVSLPGTVDTADIYLLNVQISFPSMFHGPGAHFLIRNSEVRLHSRTLALSYSSYVALEDAAGRIKHLFS